MDFSIVYHKSEHFVEKSIGEEKVLVPLSNNVADMNHVFTLNELATFIYDHVDGEKSVMDICYSMINEYDVTIDVAKKDIEQFITDSVKRGVLFAKQ